MNSTIRIALFDMLGTICRAGKLCAGPSRKPITMQQAVEQALAHNPVLLSAQQNLLSMKGQEVEAGLRANPTLIGTGTDVSLPANNPGNPYSYSAGLSRLFERGQKRRWRLDSARATTAQTEAQFHDQIRQITLQVRQGFTALLLAKATLKLAQDESEQFSARVANQP